jgi:nucleoid DNA-binding protein
MTLTRHGLVVTISLETGLTQDQVLAVLQRTFAHITGALAKGSKVELRNFGIFEVKLRKAKVGRDFRHPEIDVEIPPKARVKFRAGKEMKEAVLKLTPKPVK